MTNHNVVSPRTKIEKRLARLAGGLVLVAALIPVLAPAVRAQSVEVRVYDGHHRDYHNWNDRAYWNWRHSHPD
jgi:hypothetical protein